jgi:hypothetical protein
MGRNVAAIMSHPGPRPGTQRPMSALTVRSPYRVAIFAPSSLVLGFLYVAVSIGVGEVTMSKEIQRVQALARQLARSGTFIGWRPIAFDLQFEPGFTEAHEWIHSPSAQEELDSICPGSEDAALF